MNLYIYKALTFIIYRGVLIDFRFVFCVFIVGFLNFIVK